MSNDATRIRCWLLKYQSALELADVIIWSGYREFLASAVVVFYNSPSPTVELSKIEHWLGVPNANILYVRELPEGPQAEHASLEEIGRRPRHAKKKQEQTH